MRWKCIYLKYIKNLRVISQKNAGVAIDENGQINLFNNDSFVYDDAKEFAKQQVDLFIKDPPAMMTYTLDHQEDKDILFEHGHVLKKILHKRQSDVKETLKRPIDEDKIDCICMIGSGLGVSNRSAI